MSSDLSTQLSKKIGFFSLKLWVLIGISIGVFIVLILCLLSLWLMSRRKSRRSLEKFPLSQIPIVSKEIKVDKVAAHNFIDREGLLMIHDKSTDKDSDKVLVHLAMRKSSDADNISQCSSIYQPDRCGSSQSGEGGLGNYHKPSSSYGFKSSSPLSGLLEVSHLGWGQWFTLRDLEFATNRFSKDNVLEEGGYEVVYRGRLINGTEVVVKKLLNNLGQAKREFRVEVEAIGHVQHKNLVRLLGYCVEELIGCWFMNMLTMET